jgi:serine-type D-Ala-D-Ala carboxypeptidase (penicillin-binding protein 5/6)
MKKRYIIYLLFILFATILLDKFSVFLLEHSLPSYSSILDIKSKRKEPPTLDVKSTISLRVFNPSKKIKVLYQKNPDEKLPIASLTKLFAAVIVLENQKDYPLDKKISISKEAASQENVPLAGNYLPGKILKVENLLNDMIVFSSNDAAFALAEQMGVENFVLKMQEKARELSLLNTKFSNPTGLDPAALKFSTSTLSYFNYSTSRDLALFSYYIVENFPFIFEISLSNQNVKKIKTEDKMVIGGKTGFTDEAKRCMVLLLKDNLGYIINVILGASSLEEMQKLVDWLEK